MVFGTLPPEWGSNGFQALTALKLQLPMLSGTLPVEWGSPTAFPELSELWLLYLSVVGALPTSWGNGGFSALTDLQLLLPMLSGTLPPEWGNPSAFPELMSLVIKSTNITGILTSTTRCNTL